MGHIYYNDKRILVGETRKPKDNEFVYDQRITFQPDCLDKSLNTLKDSNVRIEWMDKDEFTIRI